MDGWIVLWPYVGSEKAVPTNILWLMSEQDMKYIQWRHVGTDQNPADIGSRGRQADKLSKLWINGPEWLTEPDHWSGDILTEPNKETEVDAKLMKEIFATIAETKDDLGEVLEKNSF